MGEMFCLLAEPEKYVACSWNVARDAEGRRYWIDLFKRNLETILTAGRASDAQARGCREELGHVLDEFDAAPEKHEIVTIITLDEWREKFLRKYGLIDPFYEMKQRENEKMLPLLPVVCRELDAMEREAQFRAIIEGIFAGNIFDMGCDATANAFMGGGPDFFETRKKLPKRPWLIDDFDALRDRVLNKPHRKCVFFVDNAGSDFLLGALPMMRWLAMRGTRVVMVANERPALNDMTILDVREWWPRIVEAEASLRGLPVEMVTSGTGVPLIDLSSVSAELNRAAADADLVVLEGMGRGVESNLYAKFKCDAVKLAMIKDPGVAKRNCGKMYDVVCKFGRGEK